MTRAQLEHVIRAAATIAGDNEIVVVVSQAILGRYPEAPAELLVSADADLYPRNHPERTDLIDGSIGELSPFHETYGYYAQGVGERTAAVLPAGWESRLVPVPTVAGTGLCLEPHDLVVAKYVAGHEKDRSYIRAAAPHGLVEREVVLALLEQTPIDPEQRRLLRTHIESDFAQRAR